MKRLLELVARLGAALAALRTHWLGYDVFISYTHRDAKGYAAGLQRRLQDEAHLVCFRDATELLAGDRLDARIERALKKSRMLVALGTPGASDSGYMVKEIETFDARRPVIGIDFEGALPLDLWPALGDRLRLPESLEALASGQPSGATIDSIQNRRHAWRRQTLGTIIITLVVILVVILTGGLILGLRTARVEQVEQTRQRQISIARRLADEAGRHEGVLAVLLAAQAWRFNEEAGGNAGREVDQALRNALKSSQISHELALPEGVAGEPIYLDHTGDWVRLAGEDGVHTLRREGRRLTLVDAETAAELARAPFEAVIRRGERRNSIDR